jgi:hypothetical protein
MTCRARISGLSAATSRKCNLVGRWGLPLCRPLSGGLWEARSSLPSKREARVLFGFYDGMLVALHAFIKKAQRTPPEELAVARSRMKEVSG